MGPEGLSRRRGPTEVQEAREAAGAAADGLSRVGSPGRTRTCNLVVTRSPAFPWGLDYLIPVGDPTATRRGRALPPAGHPARGEAAKRVRQGTTLRSSLCTVPRVDRTRGLRSGFPYPRTPAGT